MKLYLGGQFSFYIPGHPAWVDVDLQQPALLGEVLLRLGIPPAEVHLAAVNGELVELDTAVVGPGDTARIFPPIGGG